MYFLVIFNDAYFASCVVVLFFLPPTHHVAGPSDQDAQEEGEKEQRCHSVKVLKNFFSSPQANSHYIDSIYLLNPTQRNGFCAIAQTLREEHDSSYSLWSILISFAI